MRNTQAFRYWLENWLVSNGMARGAFAEAIGRPDGYVSELLREENPKQKIAPETWALIDEVTGYTKAATARHTFLALNQSEGVVAHMDFVVLAATHAAAIVFGMDSPDEMEGLDLKSVVPAGTVARVQSAMADALEHGRAWYVLENIELANSKKVRRLFVQAVETPYIDGRDGVRTVRVVDLDAFPALGLGLSPEALNIAHLFERLRPEHKARMLACALDVLSSELGVNGM